jgi:hypothetical protein
MIGGAPVNEDLVKRWGADATGSDARNALEEALKMIGVLRDLSKELRADRKKKEWGEDGLLEAP